MTLTTGIVLAGLAASLLVALGRALSPTVRTGAECVANWLGFRREVKMNEFTLNGHRMVAYVCRGCGLMIPNKGAFWKCGRCGIKFDSPS